MPVIIETLCAEDLELGIESTTKTHPGGGILNGTQISLSTWALCGASGGATCVYWTPGTIAAGSQVYTEVQVEGALMEDQVLWSLNTIGSITLIKSGHVSAEGVVTIVLANLTGDTQTVEQGLLSVLVFRHRLGPVPDGGGGGGGV